MKKLLIVPAFIFCSACLQIQIPTRPNIAQNNILAVATADFAIGNVSILELGNLNMVKDIVATHADATVKFSGSDLWVINRLGRDALFRVSPENNFAITQILDLETKANPQDLTVINNEQIMVSLYGSKVFTRLNLSDAQAVYPVDFSGYSDEDGNPEASAMLTHNGFLYLTLQRLNRLNNNNGVWPPSGTSYLVKIDLNNGQIAGSWALPFANPVEKIRLWGNKIYFSAPAKMAANYDLDGGLIIFDLISEQFETDLLKEIDLGYEIFAAIIMNSNLAFILASDALLNSYLLAVNLASGQTIATLAQHSYATGGYFSAIEIDNQNRLFLADRNIAKPGIRIFDILTLSEITVEPVDTGLPPFSLDFRP